MKLIKKYSSWILPVTFTASLASVVTSILLSTEYALVPCELCWWARILLFPVPVILAVGMLSRDHKVYRYIMPLLITGAAVTFYHSLLQWGVIEESAVTCQAGIPCADPELEIFGIFTIPFGAFLANIGLIGLMELQRREGKKIKAKFSEQADLLLRLTAGVIVALLLFLIVRRSVS